MNAKYRLSLAVFAFTAIAAIANGHDPLTDEMLQQYAADGTLDERKLRIANLRQHRMTENRAKRAIYKVKRAALEASGLSPAEAARELTTGPNMAFPFTAQPELSATGAVKTLTILVDFKDNRAATVLPSLTVASIRDNIYGTGTTVAQAFRPHESLHEYYRRASQGLVDVQGNVLGWHQFSKDRKDYEPIMAPMSLPIALRRQQQAMNDNRANFRILSEALDAFDATHDFSQYDNDNDGDIDLVTILYAGPATGWGSFWWAYRWEFFVPEATTKLFDGKRAKQFVFQFVDTRAPGNSDYDPTTLLHEMGHAFGLADYYDYDSDVGPPGGVGGLDMMHANQGNQNAFSRWLLDWIKPVVIGSGPQTARTLNASGATIGTDKAIAIFPGLSGANSPDQEMFIVENRHRVGNDEGLPGDGLLIWHVDSSVNPSGDDFLHDNSYSPRKLIRLVRADNPADFGEFERAGSSTYFRPGAKFTPNSSPSSFSYSGTDTSIAIEDIGALGEATTVRIGFVGPSASAQPLPQAADQQQPAPSTQSVESVLASDAPLDLDTLESLDQQFAIANSESLGALWAKMSALKARGNNQEKVTTVLKLLASRWASKDGQKAADSILRLEANDPLLKASLPLVLSSWAANVPSELAEWYLNDAQKTLRDSRKGVDVKFLHESFEGLYLTDPEAAINGLRKLSLTPEIVTAIDAVFHSANKMGQSDEALSTELTKLKLDVVNAQLEVFKALRAADELIKDPAKRAEFRELLQHRMRE